MQHNEHGVIANEILQSIAGSFNLEKVGTIFSPLLGDVFSAYSLLSLSLDKAMLFRNFPWSDMWASATQETQSEVPVLIKTNAAFLFLSTYIFLKSAFYI